MAMKMQQLFNGIGMICLMVMKVAQRVMLKIVLMMIVA
jgi:hypothetical protein